MLACVGFVVVLVALGVCRIRNAGRHSLRRLAAAAADMSGVGDDRQEMEWDNSALTITVNPMDQQVCLSVCLFVMRCHLGWGGLSGVGPRNHVLDGGPDTPMGRGNLWGCPPHLGAFALLYLKNSGCD